MCELSHSGFRSRLYPSRGKDQITTPILFRPILRSGSPVAFSCWIPQTLVSRTMNPRDSWKRGFSRNGRPRVKNGNNTRKLSQHVLSQSQATRIFQGSDSPGKNTLRTPLQILACRFPVLDTIGLGLALSWRIAAVCHWQECFSKKCTSRGSNSDNISDRVRPWLRASSSVEYYSWMPWSASLHTERG